MSLTTRTDVTAVKLFETLILAGIGSYVSVYDRQTTKLLQRIHSLDAQKIHGFVVSKNCKTVLVFGGKQFTVLAIEISDELSVSRCFDPVLCDDWIHSIVWIVPDIVALLTAHNAIQKWKTSDQTMLMHKTNTDNSILYSGLLLPVQEEMIVFAGTVYSEVIIHNCGNKALHRLEGHRGVIFSICCDLQKAIIVTTSDDRSVRIWTMKSPGNHVPDTTDFWNTVQIECSQEVYGHTARVMRSYITKDFIVSGGEDAAICFWEINGTLKNKIVPHQSSTVWSIDGDDEFLVTGGGDGGIALHPLTVATTDYLEDFLPFEGVVKKIQFTARNNIVFVNDRDDLVYYDVKLNMKMVHKLPFQSTYRMLSLSSCKQLVCAADMDGNVSVFLENCREAGGLQFFINTKINVSRLMSVHWAGNRHLLLCSDEGIITVLVPKVPNGKGTTVYYKFLLPMCKERYLTAATINPEKDMIICGDRCGNIHCFLKGQELPVKTFKHASGLYGPTSIIYRNKEIVVTGRTGHVKYFSIKEDNISESKSLTTKYPNFQWVEKFLDKNENIVCGFEDKHFVVSNLKTNSKILKIVCGGGHRPWDAVRFFERVDKQYEEFIRLVFVKCPFVNMFTAQLSKIITRPIVYGSQSKIIHCLKSYKTDLDNRMTYLISGGEDTTLRISSMTLDFEFQDEFVFKHLSNIRSLKTIPLNDNNLLVVSAGGRAQICVNLFKFGLSDGKIKVSCEELAELTWKGDDEERKRVRTWREPRVDFDPETRMMDVDTISLSEDRFLVFAGCSDTILRVFKIDKSKKDLECIHLKAITYHNHCILKTVYLRYRNIDVIVTATTRGDLLFWQVINDQNNFDIKQFDMGFNLKNSGSNSFDYRIMDEYLVIAVGGDNNAIDMLLLTMNTDVDPLSLNVLSSIKMDNFYCAQITGLVLLDDVMLSASVDQRVTVCRWRLTERRQLECKYVRQVYTDISDVAGLHLLERSRSFATVCVFGKGFEVLKIDLTGNTTSSS